MRRVLLAFALLAVLASPSAAQTPGEGSGVGAFVQLPNGDWVPKDHPAAALAPPPPHPLRGTIDSPAPLVTAEYFIGFPIGGWVLDCRTGQQPPFVAVLVKELGEKPSTWITNYTVERALARPDVRDAFAAECPAIGSQTGFGYTVRVNVPLAPGTYRLSVIWNDGADKARSEGRFVIVR